jgi:ureidoglycolate dehydrogenase (NAD+)
MPQITTESVLVPREGLRTFVCGCLQHAGLGLSDALLVADSLVESNLRGIDSHGVARLPHYLNRIRHGSINPRPNLNFSRVAPALGKLDGDHGLGQVVMERGTQEVISLARESGAGWVAVENSSHCGALAYYGLQIAQADMIGLLFTHSDSMVVPYGAKHAFCGTNPLCITVPGTGDATLCLDMATSVVPWNTITNASMEGVSIPEDWAVDGEGNPTCDPNKVRAVRPFGGYKGSDLGLMIDVLCSFLLGSPYGPDIAPMYGNPSSQRLLGGLIGAIDVSRFRDIAAFRTAVAALAARWNEQIPANPADPILYPGQPEIQTRRKRLTEGIPLGLNLISFFQEISQQTGVSWEIVASQVPKNSQ